MKGRPFLCASSECAAMLPTIMEGEQEVEAQKDCHPWTDERKEKNEKGSQVAMEVWCLHYFLYWKGDFFLLSTARLPSLLSAVCIVSVLVYQYCILFCTQSQYAI